MKHTIPLLIVLLATLTTLRAADVTRGEVFR